MEKVPLITTKNGKRYFNIADSEANSDPIRAGRLVKSGSRKKLKKLDEAPMYYRDENMVSKPDKK
jgi:hypothetical protein